MVANQTAQLELASASIDGVRVRDMDTGNLHSFVGICDAALADGAYGLFQVYGYRSTSILFQSGTSIATGALLIPVAGQDYMDTVASTFASNTTVTIQPVFAILGESITDSSASATISKKIFLRAL